VEHFFGFKDFLFGFGQQPFLDAKCQTATCYLTNDRTLFNQSDVVIFSVQQMNLTDLPPYRFAHQRFVFYEMESPATMDPLPLLHNRTRYGFFNWNMTYRLDSSPFLIFKLVGFKKKGLRCFDTISFDMARRGSHFELSTTLNNSSRSQE
jgi:hypothetical protein